MVVILPGAVPLGQYAKDLVHHRDLFFALAGRQLTLRYRQTAIGAVWVVLQPLLSAGILSFVFGSVADLPTDGIPSFIFAYIGMLAFGAFSQAIQGSTTALVSNAALVQKIFFPRLLLPLSRTVSLLVDFSVGLAVAFVIIVANDVSLGPELVLMPVFLVFILMLAQGVGTFLGSFAARFRDFAYITPFLLQLALYASPVAYSASAVPKQYLTVYYLNPLVALLEAFRWSLVGTPFPSVAHLSYAVGASLIAFVVGVVTFEKMERSVADVI